MSIDIGRQIMPIDLGDFNRQIMPKWWKYGRKLEFFMQNEKLIGNFITKNKLPAVSQETIAQMGPRAGGVIIDGNQAQVEGVLLNIEAANPMVSFKSLKSGKSKASMQAPVAINIKPPDICGGLKSPHLHHHGHIYLLSIAQWKKFSEPLIQQTITTIKEANSIRFEAFLDLDNATRNM